MASAFLDELKTVATEGKRSQREGAESASWAALLVVEDDSLLVIEGSGVCTSTRTTREQ